MVERGTVSPLLVPIESVFSALQTTPCEAGILWWCFSKEEARRGRRRAGRWPVQLRYETQLTGVDYVTRKAWREARLDRCPRHPQGGCGFARHGTYSRVIPPGTKIARWYCPQAQQTFSLLPDCLAARYSGTLNEFEAAAERCEQARTLEAAADHYRPEVELPGVLRWLRRRQQAVAVTLTLLRGLAPTLFSLSSPSLAGLRQRLGVEWVLVALRAEATEHLSRLPPPLGFRPPPQCGGEPLNADQHRAGPDPP